MNQELPLALRTREIVGREKELRAIRQAILDRPTTHVLAFRGPAGIGKTRLLEEVGNPEGILATDGLDFAWSGIIDLYDPETHSKSGIEQAIIEGIGRSAPELEEHFKEYWAQREEFDRLRKEMIAPRRLEELRAQLTDAFLRNYNQAAAQRRIVLAFDTAELIQFESDVIQRVCQVEEEASVIKTWLMDIAPQMENTVVLLAGRSKTETQKKLWADFCTTFTQRAQEDGFAFREPFDLKGFTLTESLAYFDKLAAAARAHGRKEDAQRIEELPTEFRKIIHKCVEGRPVHLGLAIDLAVNGKEIGDLFSPRVTWAHIAPKVIDDLAELYVGYPVGPILRYLAVARMGLDVPLLHHLEPGWLPNECWERLNWMEKLSFVKTRSTKKEGKEEENLFFLHDEMYELLDKYRVYPSRQEFVGLYSKIADYYAQQRTKATGKEEQDLKVKELHYRLREDPRRGYEEYYAKWAEFAIKAHQVGFDMRMRDESLRFHSVPENQRLSDLQGLPRDAVDRGCAVRWVKRYTAKAQYSRAVEVAETILAFGPEPYRSLLEKPPKAVSAIKGRLRKDAQRIFGVDDPLFWAHLLTSYGEVLLFYGAPASVQAPSALSPKRHEKRFTETSAGGSQVEAAAQIFLSYARPDEEKIKDLYQELSDAGFQPWMDKKDILPGEIWQSCIQKAIRRSDFFMACLSSNSISKRGFLQREIKSALDIWQEKLDSDIYLIPVRVEDCKVPESLRKFQWVNLFEEGEWTQLVKAIQEGMKRRVEVTQPVVQESTPEEGTERLRALETQVRRVLEKAISLLQRITYEEDPEQWWWRIRILGRAHNRLGYLHRLGRRYRLCIDYNHTALHYYRQLDIRDEMAETLNNAAYVYALLGDISRADKWIDDALELRQVLGQAYPLALTLNTRGLIHLLAGEPHRARPRCLEALDISQRLEDWRGQGLAYNALGLVYRTLGNLQRLGVYDFDEALDFYQKAEDALRQAVHIFRVEAPERTRLVEAYDELGSVYRDRGILLQEAGREAKAVQQFDLALEHFEKAIKEAKVGWPVDRADAHEDMADVFALQGQLDRAEECLRKAEALVPTEYRLVEGQGFKHVSEPVESFWQIMGKIHLARGHNISHPIRGLEEYLTEEQESVLLDAVEQYALAIAYFLKYSTHVRLHREAFRAVYERLKRYRLERLERAEKRVLAIANRFKVDLSPLVADIDEMLGLKALPS